MQRVVAECKGRRLRRPNSAYNTPSGTPGGASPTGKYACFAQPPIMKGIVITDICPLYKEPSCYSSLDDEVLHGMIVDVLCQTNGFLRVRTHYNYEGYALPNTLQCNRNLVSAWQSIPKWTVWSPYLDIKTSPAVQAPNVVSCTRGGLLGVTNSDEIIGNGFIKVAMPNGCAGYTRRPCIKHEVTSWSKTDEKELRAKLVNTAKLYLGTQYRWGGKTPLGIDCSGLTSMVYMLHGILIYRNANIHPDFPVKEIPFNEKKPGDLIFFPGHVALYLGNEAFIHATAYPTAIGVVINSFDPNSPVYREDLLEKVTKTGSIF